MAIFRQTSQAKGIDVGPNPNFAGEVVAVRAVYAFDTTTAINDKVEMIILPANCVPVDVILDSDDLDTATTLTMDVGIMSGDPGVSDLARTVGAEIFAATTVGQAGGVVRPTLASAFRIGSSDKDRSIGVLIKAAPTAQAGSLGMTLLYRNP